MQISACYIVRNEARIISRSLQSIQGMVDEIIVVDTGSIDNTIGMAKKYGAKVYFYRWQNDFSVARNFAIGKAKGDWILFLDADEYFAQKEDLHVFLETIELKRPEVEAIMLRLHNIDLEQQCEIGESVVVRLFRNQPNLRYRGFIHESLCNLDGAINLYIEKKGLQLLHTGYSRKSIEKKTRRNLQLLQKEMAEHGEQPQHYFYLTQCYMTEGRYAEALGYAQKALSAEVQFIGARSDLYHYELEAMRHLEEPAEKMLAVADTALEEYPRLPEFYGEKGMILSSLGRLTEAYVFLQKAFELYDTSDKETGVATYFNQSAAAKVCCRLAEIAARLSRSENAEIYFQRALLLDPGNRKFYEAYHAFLLSSAQNEIPILVTIQQQIEKNVDGADLCRLLYEIIDRQKLLKQIQQQEHQSSLLDASAVDIDQVFAESQCFPYDAVLFQRLYTYLQLLDPVDIIAYLNRLYDVQKDAGFLADSLRNCRVDSIFGYYARHAGKVLGKGERFLLQGKKQRAEQCLLQELKRLYRFILYYAEQKGWPLLERDLCLLPAEQQKAWRSCHAVPGEKAQQMTLEEQKQYPLISVMIPTYNRPFLFELTLRSALAQDYPHMEVIVCDNSTDNRTENMIQSYLSDQRLRYIRNCEAKTKEENFLPFERLARGEYLQWLMDDDILEPEKLKKMAACLKEYSDVTLVFSQRGIIDANGMRIRNTKWETALPIQNESAVYDGETIGRTFLLTGSNFLGEPSAALFRRDDLQHHYWRAESRGYKVLSDVTMWLELMEKGKCVLFRDSLSFYRRHENQEGQQVDVVLLSRIEWYELDTEYYKRNQFIHTQDEYLKLLDILVREYDEEPGSFKALASKASMEIWQRYENCIRKMKEILAGSQTEFSENN